MKIERIKITGQKLPAPATAEADDSSLVLLNSYMVGQTTRGEMESHEVKLEAGQLIEMVFEDGTTWFSSAFTLDDIFPQAVSLQARSGDAVFEIPREISLEGAERGFVNKVLLKVFNIFAKKAVDIGVEKLAARLEDKQLDERTGLFRLNDSLDLLDYKAGESNKPYCLLIHGTASSVRGSFGEMKGTALMKYLTEAYGDRILAFQHRTLTENPLQNVRDLVKQLPRNITLHLITTSRGGLVGEVLSRFCSSDGSLQGFTSAEMAILRKDYPLRYFDSLVSLIEEIRMELSTRKVLVEKFIRIACPAGGTTLAGNRLDHFLNMTLNLIGIGTGLAANPVYSAFRNLVAAIVDTKNKVDVLPGLEVQNPASPFIKALNSPGDPTNPSGTVVINNSLVVIAGNSKPALKLSALLIIASKLFFLKKNDLVVDTGSMVLGTRRSGLVQQFLFEDEDINHFKYLQNSITNSAVKQALEASWGEKLPGFTSEQLSIPESTERNILLQLEGGQLYPGAVSGGKPIVVLLPGIMGSNLSLDDTLLWINYPRFITGGLKDLGDERVKASSLVATSYKKLVEYLRDDYDVVVFPFDWRLPLPESARLLDQKLQELMKYRQPIKLIGHSMGGVLVRDFIVAHPETWAKLNKLADFRLLFLGSPLNGSFRIPAVLMGMDGVIHKLSMIDLFHSRKELLQIFTGFRGMLSLLPFTRDEQNDFAKPETWKKMRDSLGEPDWPLPSDQDLKAFGEYRDRMAVGLREEDFLHAVYVAGRDKSTTCGYRIDENADGAELVFLSTSEGDASVTWDSGIPPKMIENDSVYYVDVTHGALANEPEMFNGIREILATGSTNLFSRTRPIVRGEEKIFRSPDFRDFDLSQYAIENTLLGLNPARKPVISEPPLRVSISNGDLNYARYPLMAGHFENDGVLYAEKVIDNCLNGILSQHHQLGLYPGETGSNDIFLSGNSGFPGAIIVGLGKPGNLTGSELTRSVEQGVANYLLHMANGYMDGKPDSSAGVTGISSLIIGCGYGGLSIEASIKGIIQGVFNANMKVRNLKLGNAKYIEHIEFIEIYEDKAISGFITISRIEKEETNLFKIIREGDKIKSLLGPRKRITLDTSEGWWNRISVTKDESDQVIRCLKFVTTTNSAREEEQKLVTTPALMEGLIQELSTSNHWTPEKAKTIFELLIPNDFKDKLKRHGNILWSLDEYSANYPWELLQEGLSETKPICITSGMIRQLATDDYRKVIRNVPRNQALVIADPELNGFYPQLPGALEEGKLVAELLKAQGMDTVESFKRDHSDIIQKLFRDEYKIIHLSGHGAYNADKTKGSGMVIGKNLFLSTAEIQQMSTAPELVFVNCCHLGKIDGGAEELYQERFRLAANIGTQLINNGVKCVIAAGWAVNDEAALEFAKVFYRKMFEYCSFGESVLEARKAVYEKFGNSNTWGAYQCYGDPFYRFEHLRGSSTGREKCYLLSQEAEVELENLLNELEIGSYTTADYLDSLGKITAAVEKAGIRNSAIIEKEALVYLELGEYDQACTVFEELMNQEDTSFAFSSIERYFNVKAKKIITDYRKDMKKRTEYLKNINKVIRQFHTLLELSKTPERYNMLGSTFKRQAFLSTGKDKLTGYVQASFAYYQGYSLHPKWYALTNWLTLEGVLVHADIHRWNSEVLNADGKVEYKLPDLPEAMNMLEYMKPAIARNTDEMTYWDLVSGLNIRLCKLILQYPGTDISLDVDNIIREIKDLWKRAGSKGKRFAEIEHLEFVADALSIVENEKTLKLRNKLHEVKLELEKLI